jgi:hypothetical protein
MAAKHELFIAHSNDLDENLLNYETFVSGGHLEFLRHFEMLFILYILNF